MKSYRNFGEFITQKRCEQQLSLSGFARSLGYSATYICRVERGDANPFQLEKLNRAAEILRLSPKEYSQMMELAGKKRNMLAPDLQAYLQHNDTARAAMRLAFDLDIGEDEWLAFMRRIRQSGAIR